MGLRPGKIVLVDASCEAEHNVASVRNCRNSVFARKRIISFSRTLLQPACYAKIANLIANQNFDIMTHDILAKFHWRVRVFVENIVTQHKQQRSEMMLSDAVFV